ncbi:hypothetical protein J2T12_003961 [Paenibacillus anaericanus]|nr:hypothetical protein [Paenibacillus anaericanus]
MALTELTGGIVSVLTVETSYNLPNVCARYGLDVIGLKVGTSRRFYFIILYVNIWINNIKCNYAK